MKSKVTKVVILLLVLVGAFYLNRNYEVIAINPFSGEGKYDLKVMTWNVHCSEGTDYDRQRKIAELVLKEDADFVQLNEYNQDSCLVIDSLLKAKYPFTEEHRSHTLSGDIFYSKRVMSNSSHEHPLAGIIGLQIIKATTSIGCDSVQIFGVHLASNHYNDSIVERGGRLMGNKKQVYEWYKKSQTSRCFQAFLTKKEVIKSMHPVIVMGDMNDFSCSAPLDTFSTCGLKNAWWKGGNGYGCTFHDGWMRLRIDHILYSEKLKLCGIKVIETDLSDHNPMVAEFSVNN